jgi:hypothetical protein
MNFWNNDIVFVTHLIYDAIIKLKNCDTLGIFEYFYNK